jgi:hypothetical protein
VTTARRIDWRPAERAGRAAARYRAKREEIEPFIRLLAGVYALAALLHRPDAASAACRGADQ